MVLAVMGRQFNLLSHSVHLWGPVTLYGIFMFASASTGVVDLCRHCHGDDTAVGAGLAM